MKTNVERPLLKVKCANCIFFKINRCSITMLPDVVLDRFGGRCSLAYQYDIEGNWEPVGQLILQPLNKRAYEK